MLKKKEFFFSARSTKAVHLFTQRVSLQESLIQMSGNVDADI